MQEEATVLSPAPLGPSLSRRRFLATAAGTALASIATGCGMRSSSRPLQVVSVTRGTTGFSVRGTSYVLSVSTDGMADLCAPDGTPFTTLPLAAVPHGASPLSGTPTQSVDNGILHLTWGTLANATVTSYAQAIVVQFAIAVDWPEGGLSSDQVDFFSTATTAIDLTALQQGFTPQSGPQLAPQDQYMRYPFVSTTAPSPFNKTNYYAFAPPPLHLGLAFPAGWLGIGLVQVPNATSMWLTEQGAVALDYPWPTMTKFADSGAGGTSQGMLRFPAFVLTFAPGAYRGLGTYGQALVGLGAVNKPPLAQQRIPRWWYGPLVDTFGQQEVEGITNGDPGRNGFTAAWVRSFAQQWATRFGTKAFTLIVDATWQQDPGPNRVVGSPRPGPLFGGYAGMRQLVDELHAQGIHVLLWWQAWGRVPGSLATQLRVWHDGSIDPTSANFPEYVQSVTQTLLGSRTGDLNADGLKIDFNYWAPVAARYPWDNPSLGMGTAASYRYFQTFHRYAHAVKADALITASIAAPQFADVMDAVRLNDASTEAQWQSRARIVAEAMPQVLIDSDGGNTMANTALEHFLTAAVYGIPDDYYLSQWANGPMTASEARIVGAIQRLGGQRQLGTPVYRGPADWAMVRDGRITAETLFSPQINGPAGLAVWRTNTRVTVLSAYDARLNVPLYGATVARVEGTDQRVHVQQGNGGVTITLTAGESAVLVLHHAPVPLPSQETANL